MSSYQIVKFKTTKNEIYYCKIGYRDSNGKCRSKGLGTLGKASDYSNLSIEERNKSLKEKADALYKKYLEESSEKATVLCRGKVDVAENEHFNIGSYYISYVLNKLRITTMFDSLKGEKRQKFKFNLSNISEKLIIQQILNPGSKRYEFNDFDSIPFGDEIRLHEIYRALDVINRHADEITAYSYKQAKKLLGQGSKLFYYDCTDFYYTQGCEGDLLGMKVSKEGIYAPLVQLGLLIDEWGLLVGMIVFKGNLNEQHSLKEQIQKISTQINLNEIVVCTDSGLCSLQNKAFLSSKNRAYITTEPIGKLNDDNLIVKWVLNDTEYKDENGKNWSTKELISRYNEAIERNDSNAIKHLYNKTLFKSAWYEPEIYKKTVIGKTKNGRKKWDKKKVYPSMNESFETNENTEYKIENYIPVDEDEMVKGKFYIRYIASFSVKYYLEQMKNIEKEVKKIDELSKNNNLKKLLKSSKKKYINVKALTNDGEMASKILYTKNLEDIESDKLRAGFYLQSTNLKSETKEIFKDSRMRWQIEYCFRTMKLHFNSKTIYLSKPEHIIAHFVLIFLTLQTLKTMMYLLYHENGYKNDKIGRIDNELLTIDNVINGLRNLKGTKYHAQEGFDFFRGQKRSDLYDLMEKTFGFSLTKEMMKIKDLERARNK